MYIHWKRMRDEISLQNLHKWVEGLRYCLFLNGETASYISLIYLSQCLEGCCHQMRSLDAFCGNLRGEASIHLVRLLPRPAGSWPPAPLGKFKHRIKWKPYPKRGGGAQWAHLGLEEHVLGDGTKGLSDQPWVHDTACFQVWIALDGV